MTPLRPDTLAATALAELLARSTFLRRDLVERDRVAVLDSAEAGDHAFVLTESAPRGLAVPLGRIVDVTFAVEGPDWYLPLDEFASIYLVPAVDALAAGFDRRVSDELERDRDARGNYRFSPIVFASAPQPVAPGSLGHVVTYQGVSLRLTRWYDIGRRQHLVTIDMLYGLRTTESLVPA